MIADSATRGLIPPARTARHTRSVIRTVPPRLLYPKDLTAQARPPGSTVRVPEHDPLVLQDRER